MLVNPLSINQSCWFLRLSILVSRWPPGSGNGVAKKVAKARSVFLEACPGVIHAENYVIKIDSESFEVHVTTVV